METKAIRVGLFIAFCFLVVSILQIEKHRRLQERQVKNFLGSLNGSPIYTTDLIPGENWESISKKQWRTLFEEHIDESLMKDFLSRTGLSPEQNLEWTKSRQAEKDLAQAYEKNLVKLLRTQNQVLWQKK